MFWGSWTRGFRSGNFNARAPSVAALGPAEPEQADQFEVGMKGDFADGRLRANIAAFYTIYDEIQRVTNGEDELGPRRIDLQLVAQARDVLADLPTQGAFHDVVRVDDATDLGQLVFGQLRSPGLTVDLRPQLGLAGSEPDPGRGAVAVGAAGTTTSSAHTSVTSRLPGVLSQLGATLSLTVIVTTNGSLTLPHSSVAS